MKIKPVIQDRLSTRHTSYEVDLILDYNITFIVGDSGIGKSAVFSFIQEMSAENKTIRCFNFLDKKKNYKSTIKRSKNKLFVIDNADILLDDAIRQYISMDTANQYIIIGRNPAGLMLAQDEIYEITHKTVGDKVRFYLTSY